MNALRTVGSAGTAASIAGSAVLGEYGWASAHLPWKTPQVWKGDRQTLIILILTSLRETSEEPPWDKAKRRCVRSHWKRVERDRDWDQDRSTKVSEGLQQSLKR